MKRIFDTIIIFDTGLDEATMEQKIQKIENAIKSNEGEITKQEKWGKRRLAFEIKKKADGFYVYFLHNSDPTVVEQLHNLLRFDESILKSITVQVDQVKRSRYNRKKGKKKEKPAAEVVVTASTPTTTSTREEGETNG